MNRGIWRHPKRKREMPGFWEYLPNRGCFMVTLIDPDPVTGLVRCFDVYDERPDFNGWIYHAHMAANPVIQSGLERCHNCDDTGDVHRADGEWLGVCDCQAFFDKQKGVDTHPTSA